MTDTNGDWRNDAHCRTEDPDLFFPTAGEGTPAGRVQYAQARAVCAMCPVRRDCLDYAIELGLDNGMFGGMTPNERRKIQRQQRISA